MTKPLIKGWKAVSSLIILTLTTAILFYWISSVLKPKSQNLSGNYPPSPLVDVIAQYKKANPEIPFPRDYVNQCARPQNPVVAENCRQGDEEWVIRKNSFDILGFASSTSVNKGETIQFFIDTPSPRFDLSIFRLGFYRGKGGRLLETIPDILGKKQPPCRVNYQTGLTSCSNWALSFNLNIPASWISGIYLAKMVQKDTGGENYILFVVRDDDSHSDMLYQQSVTDSQAYNNYGGKSLYSNNSNDCNTVSGTNRAVEVSFDRPYNAPMGDPSTFFRAEYPMVRWLEAQGYWVTYSTDLDTHRAGKQGSQNTLLDHKIFLAVGHDEYWSPEMRAAITSARDAGVNIGIFSGNTSFWSVRFTADPWSGKADRTMVTYKTTESGGPDPSGIPTTTWRDPQGVGQPENALIGIEYIGDNETNYFPLRVNADQATDPLFRNTGLENIPPGAYVDIGKSLVGYEWDGVIDNGHSPGGLTVLFDSPVFEEILQDAGSNFLLGKTRAETAYYQASSGSIVFASGTIQWSWGLDLYEPDATIQQITCNLFERMGVKPATPDSNLVVDGFPTNQKRPPLNLTLKGTTNPPVITDISLQYSRPYKLTIVWQTDKSSTSQVWYWIANSKGCFGEGSVWYFPLNASATDLAQDHQVDLLSLKPGEEYHFELISQDEQGNSTLSTPVTFVIPSGGMIERFSSEFQSVESAFICRAKPWVAPGFNWLRQINPWILSTLISILFLILGIWILNHIGLVHAR